MQTEIEQLIEKSVSSQEALSDMPVIMISEIMHTQNKLSNREKQLVQGAALDLQKNPYITP